MEKFCLKTVDFQTNISKSFQRLRNQDDFCDVTLVGEDFKQVKAHKVVLSSCSEYFKNILLNNKSHPGPMLCLYGVNQEDLNNILDYIYMGQLEIYHEEIDRFLEIAQRLRLHGMDVKNHEQQELKTTLQELNETPDSHYEDGEMKLEKKRTKPSINSKVKAEEPNLLHDDNNKLALYKEKRSISLVSSNFQSIDELNEKIKDCYYRNAEGILTCRFCSRTFRQTVHIKEHVEIHIEGLVFPCNVCESIFTTRNVLRSHLKRIHGV